MHHLRLGARFDVDRSSLSHVFHQSKSWKSNGWNHTKKVTFHRLYTTSGEENTYTVAITDKCAEMINKLKTQDWLKNPQNAKLRLTIEGGGCSGFQYSFNVDDANELSEEDVVFEKNGAKIVIDNESLKHVNGSTVDYKEEMIGSRFVVSSNPQSSSKCSCGSSFESSVKD